MALYSAKRHARVRGAWPVNLTYTPSPLPFLGSYATPIVTATTGGGNTIYASSPLRDDVQAAINTAIDGDTVIIPPGSATWTSRTSSPNIGSCVYWDNKRIWLKGSGKTQTIITDGQTGSNWLQACIKITGSKKFRISDMSILNHGGHGIGNHSSARDWMVHDCNFTGRSGSTNRTIWISSLTAGAFAWGLVYNCDIQDGCVDMYCIEGTGTAADYLWSGDAPLGTADAVYVENCNYHRTTDYSAIVLDNNNGGRTVLRYTTTSTHHMYTHVQGTAPRGPRTFECYNCTFRADPWSMFAWCVLMGGTGVIWGNRVYGDIGDENVEIMYARGRGSTDSINYGVGHDWATHNWADGTYIYNGRYVDGPPAGYPGRDQLGRGKDGAGAYPQEQALVPSYFWDNLYTPSLSGTPSTLLVGHVRDSTAYYHQHNRDWYHQVASFDGSSGMGKGLLSERPESCTTTGVGYWATDEQKLYVWNGSSWDFYYQPYTYPHPLRSVPWA